MRHRRVCCLASALGARAVQRPPQLMLYWEKIPKPPSVGRARGLAGELELGFAKTISKSSLTSTLPFPEHQHSSVLTRSLCDTV